METKANQIVDSIEKLVDEKMRLESVKSKRDELLKRNVSEDLIRSSLGESKKRIAQARLELMSLVRELEQKSN